MLFSLCRAILAVLLATRVTSCAVSLQQPLAVSNPKFSYVNDKGPADWYAIDPDTWSDCATGSVQSPINIQDDTVGVAGPIVLDIKSVRSAEIENLGTTVEINLKGLGDLRYSGTTYVLQQTHFHTPSEHRINGIHYEMEMHMVFKTSSGAIAVLSQLYQVGSAILPPDPLLASLLKNLDSLGSPGSSSETGPLVFGFLERRWADEVSWTYQGSLTTPPCSEGVTWLVHSSPLTVDVSTYLKLKNIMGFNSRFVQNRPHEENVLKIAGEALKNKGKL